MSLAVWIGGACAEIDALRRAGQSSTATATGEPMYTELLEAAGYSGVTIDVISGASAGGLNGVILSTAIVYGAPFATMRDVWIELADIEAMMRSPRDSRPPSLLEGDRYFLAKLQAHLERLIRESVGAADNPDASDTARLDLYLSATLLKPELQQVAADPDDVIAEPRYSAAFHFSHNSEPCRSDFAGKPHDVARKLAIAGRATSSFPIAFEPTRITSNRPTSIQRRADPKNPDDLFGIFSESRTLPIDIIDGGVLDNIPVERAVEAIESAPADGPTERFLLFLHPSPDVVRRDEESSDHAESAISHESPRAVETGLRVLSIKGDTESLNRDVQTLVLHNEEVRNSRHVRREMLATVDLNPEDVIEKANARYGAYRKLRGSFAADEIVKLLHDPGAYLGFDPFPERLEPLHGRPKTYRERLWTAVSNGRRAHLPAEHPFPSEYELRPVQAPHLLDIGALCRLCDVLMEWLREQEDHAGRPDVQQAGRLKRALYDVRALSNLLLGYDDLYWAAHARPRVPIDCALWAREAFKNATAVVAFHGNECGIVDALREAAIKVSGAGAMSVDSSIAIPDEVICSLDECLTGRVTDVFCGRAPALPEGAIDLRKELWVLLARIVAGVRSPTAVSSDGRKKDPVHAALGAAAERSLEDIGFFLAALEVVTFPVLMVLPAGAAIEFRRVSAANRTPLTDKFPGGRDDDGNMTRGPKWKLAGNELMNFAAFYKASWRANDWMWGRMDAVASLVDLLVDPKRVRAHYRADTEEDNAKSLCTKVESLVKRPVPLSDVMPREKQLWGEHYGAIWERNKKAVRSEIAKLFLDEPTDLLRTRNVLIERMQWDVLLKELPEVVLAEANEEKHPLRDALEATRLVDGDPLREPVAMERFLRRYQVGEETISGEVGTARFSRVAANLARIGWKAVAEPAPAALRPVGWLIGAVRLLVLTVATAPRWALATFPVIALVSTYLAFEGPILGIARTTFALVALATLAVMYYASRLERAILFVAAFAVAVVIAFQIDADSVSLRIGGDPTSARVIDLGWVVGLLSFLAVAWIFNRLPYPRRWWVRWISLALGAATIVSLLVLDVSTWFESRLPDWVPEWSADLTRPLSVLVAVGMPGLLEGALTWSWPLIRQAFAKRGGVLVIGVVLAVGSGVAGWFQNDVYGIAYTITAAVLVVWLLRRELHPGALGLTRRGLQDAGPWVFGFLLAGAVVVAIWASLDFPGVENVTKGARATGKWDLACILTRILFVTALFEEMIFRGALWEALARRTDAGVALLFSSLFFGLWHVGARIHAFRVEGTSISIWPILVDVLVTTLLGFALGGLRIRTRGIVAGIAGHAALNSMAAIGYFLSRQ